MCQKKIITRITNRPLIYVRLRHTAVRAVRTCKNEANTDEQNIF